MVCIRAAIAHIGRFVEFITMVGLILLAVCITLAAETAAIDEASPSAFVTQARFITGKPMDTVVISMTLTSSLRKSDVVTYLFRDGRGILI